MAWWRTGPSTLAMRGTTAGPGTTTIFSPAARTRFISRAVAVRSICIQYHVLPLSTMSRQTKNAAPCRSTEYESLWKEPVDALG